MALLPSLEAVKFLKLSSVVFGLSKKKKRLGSNLPVCGNSSCLILLSIFGRHMMSCVAFLVILAMLSLELRPSMSNPSVSLSPFLSPVVYVAGDFSCVRGMTLAAFDSLRRLLKCLDEVCRRDILQVSQAVACPSDSPRLSSLVWVPSLSWFASDVAYWRALASSSLVFCDVPCDHERFEVRGSAALLYIRSDIFLLLLSFLRRLCFFNVWRSSDARFHGSCGVFSSEVFLLWSHFSAIGEVYVPRCSR